MSRAFVSDKEDWIYCPKAGERCMHAAEAGKPCTETGCEHFSKVVKDPDSNAVVAKIVKKSSQKTKQKQAKPSKPGAAGPARKTQKSKLEKPKKWGGRSGGFW